MRLEDYAEIKRLNEAKKTPEEKKTRRDVYILLDKYRSEVEKSRKKLEEDMKDVTAKIRDVDTNDWGAIDGLKRLYSSLGDQLVLIGNAKRKLM